MERMKAGVVCARGDLRVTEVDRPLPGPGDVLVRVALTGICGSDVPRVLGDACHFYPIVLGHEFSGTVEEVGEGVSSVSVGDRVAGVPLVPCHECEDCRSGNYALCKHYSFVGSRQPGSFAEFVALPERNVVRFSATVPFDRAVFFEPSTVAIHALLLAVRDADRFDAGATVAVVGSGTIGILLAQWARIWGAETVVIIGRREQRLNAARSVGIEHALDSGAADFGQSLHELTGGRGFDYVFECAGSGDTIRQSIALAGNHGTVCFVGTPKDELTFSVRDWEQINRRELWLTGSWMSYSAPFPGKEWARTAEEFSAGHLLITDEMIDRIYPLDEIVEAFGRFAGADRPVGKILVDSRGGQER
jgi:L-iditol 2-dehydrogenase